MSSGSGARPQNGFRSADCDVVIAADDGGRPQPLGEDCVHHFKTCFFKAQIRRADKSGADIQTILFHDILKQYMAGMGVDLADIGDILMAVTDQAVDGLGKTCFGIDTDIIAGKLPLISVSMALIPTLPTRGARVLGRAERSQEP